jgi:hypothetical protein
MRTEAQGSTENSTWTLAAHLPLEDCPRARRKVVRSARDGEVRRSIVAEARVLHADAQEIADATAGLPARLGERDGTHRLGALAQSPSGAVWDQRINASGPDGGAPVQGSLSRPPSRTDFPPGCKSPYRASW